MRSRWLLLLVGAASVLGACSDDGLCSDDSGETHIEVDAAALSQPGSRLEVCINDLCNEEDPDSTFVSVGYNGEHPSVARWTIQRVTGGHWEGIAGDEVDLSCSSDPTSVRIELDAEAQVTVTRLSNITP